MTFNEFKNKYGISLNEQQCEAVKATDGAVLLLAVPGSGKTTVLVTRLGYMIYCLGIHPKSILTMTYTVAATNDMRSRFCSIFGEQLREQLEFRTINGVCAKIIKSYERMTGRTAFDLLSSEKDISAILSNIYRETVKGFPTESDIKNIRALITYTKNMMLSDEEIENISQDNIPFGEIYRKYCDELKLHRLMDYDDQMIYAYRILKQYPVILERIQNQYQYICVDEAQDTSKIQHCIISLIAQKSGNLFMVGDEDQSIYGFRAAYPEALMSFEKDYENAKILLMEENFRSNARIVSAADHFIQKNLFRHEKTMKAARPKGSDIREIHLDSRNAQYRYLLKVAQNCQTETAVLYRDNESALPLIDLLERNNILYKAKAADHTFFTHRVVQDISNIIRFAINPYDTDIFMQIYYKISTYLNKTYAVAACDLSRRDNIPVLDAALSFSGINAGTAKSCKTIKTHLENLLTDRADRAIFRIANFMGYGDYLSRSGIKSNKIDILESIGANEKNPRELLRRLSELSDISKDSRFSADCNFILSTIHSSKGLEYDTVYLLDVCDGVFPELVIKGTDSCDSSELRAYEEERRLFYVGVTRAKNDLNIFTYKDEKSTFCDDLLDENKQKPIVTGVSSYKTDSNKQLEYNEFCEKYQRNANIQHKTFGSGTVLLQENDAITVKFASGEIRKLSLKILFEYNFMIE